MMVRFCKTIVLPLLSVLLLWIFCTSDKATSPSDTSKATIALILKSPANGSKSAKSYSDTLGDSIRIGIIAHVPTTIDSARMVIISRRGDTALSYRAKFSSSRLSDDTAWHTYFPRDSGWQTIKATAYLKNGTAYSDSVMVMLYSKVLPADTTKPVVRLLSPARASMAISSDSLTILFSCKDMSGIASVVCKAGDSAFPAIRSNTDDSTWSTTVANLVPGINSAIELIAIDKSPNANTETLSVHVKYDCDTTAPKVALYSPANDSACVFSSACSVKVVVGDESGIDRVVCDVGENQFTSMRLESVDSIWSFGISGLAPGINAVRFTVVDSSLKGNTATLTVYINYEEDSLPPEMRLIAPLRDSLAVDTNFFGVKVACSDRSGVKSLTCRMDGAEVTVTNGPGDSIWQANVTDLPSGRFVRVSFVAIDSSENANKDSLEIFLKYDPDTEGPAFVRVSGPVSGEAVKDSAVSITVSITDTSGVDSVYWTRGGLMRGTLSQGADGNYSLVDTLGKPHFDTITIHAQDKSNNRNKSVFEIVLDYNLPPIVEDTAVATPRNTSVSWTMHAFSPDGDPLIWSTVTAPQGTSGSVSGILPSLTFTPLANWEGSDSVLVKVTDGVLSDTATVRIAVLDPLVEPKNIRIILQAASDTVMAGSSTGFTLTVNPDVNPSPVYQWYFNGAPIPGATESSLVIGSVALQDAGAYSVTATNSQGSANSQVIFLKVTAPPSITAHPQPDMQVKCAGEGTAYTVTASGAKPLIYQWSKNGIAIPAGATEATFSIASLSESDSGIYSCVVSNKDGSATSLPVKLTVRAVPAIILQPVSAAKSAGEPVSFSVEASGTAPLMFQWKKDGVNVASGDAATLSISSVAQTDAGSYTCVVTNGCGSGAISDAAILTVNAP